MQIYLRKVLYPFFLSFILIFVQSLPNIAYSDFKTRIIFLSDLNLYPTPVSTIRAKSSLEKKNGLLVYESQAILQELIGYINQKLQPDYVVFGGNNILDTTDKQFDSYASIGGIDLWHLFLDMVSELKSNYYFVCGNSELKLNDTDALIRSLSSIGLISSDTWWYKKIADKNILLIGLDSSLFSVSPSQSGKQLKWLNAILSNNKDLNTIIFAHDSIIDPNGKVINNRFASQVFKLIKQHIQVKLFLSGGLHLNRIRKANNSYLVVSSSTIAYPCTFKSVELSSSHLTVKTVKIPLKGIVKKSEKSLSVSDFALMNFLDSPKSVLDYVSGVMSDNDLDVAF